jgi:hypothetical protein
MQRVLGVVGGHPNDRRKDAHELRRANHCAREDDRRGQIYTRPPCASKQPRAYEWWVAQRKEARTTRRTVPQIIPVATTIAVGKLIKDPFFQPIPPYESWVFQVSDKSAKTDVRPQTRPLPASPHLWTSLWRRASSSALRLAGSLIPPSNSGKGVDGVTVVHKPEKRPK